MAVMQRKIGKVVLAAMLVLLLCHFIYSGQELTLDPTAADPTKPTTVIEGSAATTPPAAAPGGAASGRRVDPPPASARWQQQQGEQKQAKRQEEREDPPAAVAADEAAVAEPFEAHPPVSPVRRVAPGAALRRRGWPSGLRCVEAIEAEQVHPRIAVPVLSNVRVDITSDTPATPQDAVDECADPPKHNRRVDIHLCGADAPEVAARLKTCLPFWKNFVTPPERSNEGFGPPWSDGVMVPTRLVLHPNSLAPCHMWGDHEEAPEQDVDTIGTARSVMVEDDVWLTARYRMDNQYHGMYEQGLVQTWATWRDVAAAATRRNSSAAAAAEEEEEEDAHVTRRLLLHEYNSSSSSRRLTMLSVRDMSYAGPRPFHSLWPLVLPVHVRTLPLGTATRLYARRMILSHYNIDSIQTPGFHAFAPMQPFLARVVREAAEAMRRAMAENFGAVAVQDKLIYDNRPVMDRDYVNGGSDRARGIQDYLRAEITAALVPAFASSATVGMFSEGVPLEQQWQQLQRHKLVVGSEGAFFAWLPLAANGSTWVMVFNHTCTMKCFILWSNYHAKLAHQLPFVRLVVYVVDNGRREAVSAIAQVLRDVPWKGGDVLHIGAMPDGSSMYNHLPWPATTPADQTLAALIAAQRRIVLKSAHQKHVLQVVLHGDEGTASMQSSVVVQNTSRAAHAFILLPDGLLGLEGTDLVLLRRADGRVVMAPKDLHGSKPFLVQTRNMYPYVVLQLAQTGHNTLQLLRAQKDGAVDISERLDDWEKWTIAAFRASVASLASSQRPVVLRHTAHDRRSLQVLQPADRSRSAGMGVALHATALAQSGSVFVVQRQGGGGDRSSYVLVLKHQRGLALSLLRDGSVAVAAVAGHAGSTPLRVIDQQKQQHNQKQYTTYTTTGDVLLQAHPAGTFLSSNPKGVVNMATHAIAWEQWTLSDAEEEQ